MGTFALTLLLFQCALQLGCCSYNTGKTHRPIQIDDLVTPADLLPIVRRLIEKVERPGEGKGIVSSAKSNHQLADRLFQRFFFTNARYAVVGVVDIPGLDSLQALALSGDEFDPAAHFMPLHRKDFKNGHAQKCRYVLITRRADKEKLGKGNPKKDITKLNLKLELNKMRSTRLKTRRTTDMMRHGKKILPNEIITKVVRQKREVSLNSSSSNVNTTSDTKDARRRRKTEPPPNHPHIIPQAKKLLKDRMMVVKMQRKKRSINSTDLESPERGTKVDRRILLTRLGRTVAIDDFPNYDVEDPDRHFYNKITDLLCKVPPLKIDKKNCYWQYRCEEATSFAISCNLVPECADTDSDHFIRDDLPFAHNADEHDLGLRSFRREVGVCLVDEQIERIIERRFKRITAARNSLDVNRNEKKHKENIKAYFENLIFAQNKQTTTEAPSTEDKQKKILHKFKYLRMKNPYSNVAVQQKIKQNKMRKEKEAQEMEKASNKLRSLQKGAVISLTTPITTPLPHFVYK